MATTSTYNHRTLCKEVLVDEQTAMYWLQRKHLLASSMLCSKCSSGCRIVPHKGSFSWRCPRKCCQTVVSIQQNSFYSGSHLPLTDCIEMTYYWSWQQPVTMTMIETGHSSHIVVDWNNFHHWFSSIYFQEPQYYQMSGDHTAEYPL